LCLARESQFRLRDLAVCAGITERATHRIVSDLVDAGYLTRHRLGARNYYEVHLDRPMRHPQEEGHEIGEVLAPLLKRRQAT
jgi:DNA-binding IclR family transcriptional regulator